MIPLSQIPRKVKRGYSLKSGEKLNQLLLIDDLKLFAKDERERNNLLLAVPIFSNDVRTLLYIYKLVKLNTKRYTRTYATHTRNRIGGVTAESYSSAIRTVKSFQRVSRSTASRWCKEVLSNAGVDIRVVGAHSIRSSATS